jgi:single-strand DNA-binding protein
MNNIKNRVQLIGNLGNDPIVKNLSHGKKLVRFSLATTESYKNSSGEKVENTHWHNIVAWENLAEIIEKYIKKGSQVAVEGKLTYREYEGENAVKKHITEVVANEVLILSNRRKTN